MKKSLYIFSVISFVFLGIILSFLYSAQDADASGKTVCWEIDMPGYVQDNGCFYVSLDKSEYSTEEKITAYASNSFYVTCNNFNTNTYIDVTFPPKSKYTVVSKSTGGGHGNQTVHGTTKYSASNYEPGTSHIANFFMKYTHGVTRTATAGIPFSIKSLTPVNNASCAGISAPNSVQTNQSFSATVSMRNTGTKTWTNTDANPHKLGSQDPGGNWIWGLSRVNLPGQISPGATASFNFTATAPSTPGTKTFSWKMLEEGIEWFGAKCSKNITVTTPLINGSCGTAERNYLCSDSSYSGTLCSSGTSNPANPSFPSAGESSSWTCQGSNGGSNASCTATRSSCPRSVTISGKVTNNSGSPINGATINLCGAGTATTNSSGNYSKTVSSGTGYCSRIDSGLPPGYTSIRATNNNSCISPDFSTYEWQRAGQNVFVGCSSSDWSLWDRNSDSNVDFVVNYPSVDPPTLSVSLTAIPSSGNAPLNVDLTATVGGTQTGTINYTFYCNRSDSGTNIIPGWIAKYDSTNDNPKTALCNYSTAGTYTPKVIVERGSLVTENRQTVTVTASACSCDSWTNQGCGVSPCAISEMKMTRTCNPAGCDTESQCIPTNTCRHKECDGDNKCSWFDGPGEDLCSTNEDCDPLLPKWEEIFPW